jgi:hypothetical protein
VAFSRSFLYLRASQKFCGGTYHIHYNAAATSYYMVAIIALGVWSNWACRYGNAIVGVVLFLFFFFFEKHSAREQEKKKERTNVQTKDHSPKCRMHNGSSKRRKHET